LIFLFSTRGWFGEGWIVVETSKNGRRCSTAERLAGEFVDEHFTIRWRVLLCLYTLLCEHNCNAFVVSAVGVVCGGCLARMEPESTARPPPDNMIGHLHGRGQPNPAVVVRSPLCEGRACRAAVGRSVVARTFTPFHRSRSGPLARQDPAQSTPHLPLPSGPTGRPNALPGP